MSFFLKRCKECGYNSMTSFDSMLSEAEPFGTEAVEKAYREIRNRWDSNAKYLTELTVLLNEKGLYLSRRNRKLSDLYTKLFHETYLYAEQHLYENERSYFYGVMAKFNM